MSERTSNEYDVVYTASLSVAEYGRKLKERGRARWINGSENVEFRRTLSYLTADWGQMAFDAKRPYIYGSALRLKSYERQVLTLADATVVCTDEDRDRYLELAPDARVFVISNGVEPRRDAALNRPAGNVIAFVGLMNSLPNIQAVRHFAGHILPLIKKDIPDITFLIIGDKPTPDILDLESEHIRVLGYVEDMASILDDIAVFVVPLISGGGIKTKTLFGLANQKPVVSTPHGVTGLRVRHGKELLIGDDPASFAAAVVNLLKNDALYVEVARNGYEYVTEHHSWERAGQLFQDVIESL